MNISMKITCKKIEQEISLKKEDKIYITKLVTTKNILIPEQEGGEICWKYTDYRDALDKYISLAVEQANLISTISL